MALLPFTRCLWRDLIWDLQYLNWLSLCIGLHGLSYISLKILLGDMALVRSGTRSYTLCVISVDHSREHPERLRHPACCQWVGETSTITGISSLHCPLASFRCSFTLLPLSYSYMWGEGCEARVTVLLQVLRASISGGTRGQVRENTIGRERSQQLRPAAKGRKVWYRIK